MTASTKPPEQLSEAARVGQDAFTGALQTWNDSIHQLVGLGDTDSDRRVRTASDLIDNWFGFAEQVLHVQREFAKATLAAAMAPFEVTARAARQTNRDAIRDGCKADARAGNSTSSSGKGS